MPPTVRISIAAAQVAALAVCLAPGASAGQPALQPSSLSSQVFDGGRLGLTHVFRPAGPPQGVAVLLSGDGGWKPDDAGAHMAEALAGRGLLVLGADVNRIKHSMASLGGRPLDLGGRLQTLAEAAGRRYGVSAAAPIYLAGYSSGATLAYAAFSQSGQGQFAGLVTEGFCAAKHTGRPVGGPSGHTSAYRRFGLWGWVYRPERLSARWGLVEGDREHGCWGGGVARFVSQTGDARLWMVRGVRHSFSPPEESAAQLQAAISWVLMPAAGG